MEKKLNLSLPNEETIKKELIQKTSPEQERIRAIREASEAQAAEILKLDISDASGKAEVLKAVEVFGEDAVAASNRKNAFLSKRIAAFQNNSNETGAVATGLTELSVQMKNLDPTGIRFSERSRNKLFNPVRKYFLKFEKADTVIDSIIDSISGGERQLKNDNQTLLSEQTALEEETRKLAEYIEMGKGLDEALSALIEKAREEGVEERNIAFFESEVLFPLRQKVMDMGTLIAVNYQGIGAIDIIRKNNAELIRGVQRAKQVSVTALRIGVMCAQALYHQELVLKAVGTLSESTATILEANAAMLQGQSEEIHRMAANPMIAVETLKQSFQTVFEVLENCETYRREALGQMAQAVDTFSQMGEEGARRLQQMNLSKI